MEQDVVTRPHAAGAEVQTVPSIPDALDSLCDTENDHPVHVNATDNNTCLLSHGCGRVKPPGC